MRRAIDQRVVSSLSVLLHQPLDEPNSASQLPHTRMMYSSSSLENFFSARDAKLLQKYTRAEELLIHVWYIRMQNLNCQLFQNFFTREAFLRLTYVNDDISRQNMSKTRTLGFLPRTIFTTIYAKF